MQYASPFSTYFTFWVQNDVNAICIFYISFIQFKQRVWEESNDSKDLEHLAVIIVFGGAVELMLLAYNHLNH